VSLSLLERFSDFLEKIPDVQVWYLRFLETDSLEDVRGRISSPDGRASERGELKTSMGSLGSTRGVAAGELLLEWLNQKYFFLLGGLPEVNVPGDPEADRGRLGRLIMDRFLSEAMPDDKVDKASAVFGLSGETEVLVEDVTTTIGLGVGLAAIELMLPDREWQPRMVELLPSVSDEIMDKGLGMTST
jgi:hypothetical protein